MKGLRLLLILSCVFTGCLVKPKSKGEDKILLRWAGYAYPVYDKFRAEESKKFEQLYPNVTVSYEPIVGEFRSIILTQIAGGVAPDMFFVADPLTYIQKNVLVDLTDYAIKDKEYFKDIHPALMQAQTWNDRIYTLPGNCNADVLYYNKALFDEMSLPYPDESWTWQDLFEASKKLTKRDASGRIIQYGCVNGNDLMLYILQNGGRLWNEDKTKCIVASTETEEAIQFWKDLYAKYKVCPTPLEMREQGTREPFIMGRAAMYCGSSWEIATFKIKGSKEIDWEITLLPNPVGKKRFIGLHYFSLGIWSKSKHPDLAYELAKFMLSPERTKFLIQVGDSLPLRMKGEDMEFYLKNPGQSENTKKTMLKALELSQGVYPILVNPHIPIIQQEALIRENLEKFLLGDIPAGKVLKDIEEKLNLMLKEKVQKF